MEDKVSELANKIIPLIPVLDDPLTIIKKRDRQTIVVLGCMFGMFIITYIFYSLIMVIVLIIYMGYCAHTLYLINIDRKKHEKKVIEAITKMIEMSKQNNSVI